MLLGVSSNVLGNGRGHGWLQWCVLKVTFHKELVTNGVGDGARPLLPGRECGMRVQWFAIRCHVALYVFLLQAAPCPSCFSRVRCAECMPKHCPALTKNVEN